MQKRQGEKDNCEVKRLKQNGFKIYDARKQTQHTLQTVPFMLFKKRDLFSDQKNVILNYNSLTQSI